MGHAVWLHWPLARSLRRHSFGMVRAPSTQAARRILSALNARLLAELPGACLRAWYCCGWPTHSVWIGRADGVATKVLLRRAVPRCLPQPQADPSQPMLGCA